MKYLRWFLLTIAILMMGCRSAEFLASGSLSTSRTLPLVAPVQEAAHHRRELHFVEALEGLSSEPQFTQMVSSLQEAEAARHQGDPRCIGMYAEIAMDCWPMLPSLEPSGSWASDSAGDPTADSTAATTSASYEVQHPSWLIYHHCLACLMEESQRHGQFDPQQGIRVVNRDGQTLWIPVTHHGFAWKAEDFNELHVVDTPLQSHLKRYWSDPGLGVPLVALRRREQATLHMAKMVPYSATAILRPSGLRAIGSQIARQTQAGDPSAAAVQAVAHQEASSVAILELHDPLRVTSYSDSDRHWGLARDVSAPLGFAQSHLNRDNLKSFLNPGRTDEFAGLRMLEPYQPGKIPIVFVHGLLSDRLTWIDLINDLRNASWIPQHYQIWLYQYPTGTPFVLSAAKMRRSLHQAVAELDPQGTDPALSQMVLIGHSMGGLVSKLLITRSGDELWNSIANVPIDQVQIDPEKRPQIESIFFFEPVPHVQRVVFIGSPHQGSQVATSWIGKLGSTLVHGSRETVKATKTLLRDNPGVFEGLEDHLPTSVDLLRPDNPILQAVYGLPVSPEVQLHTIIGTGHPLRDGTPADGVVPVSSARHPSTESERRIESTHTALPDHPETTREVTRILAEHLRL